MNNTADPEQQIANARFLRDELEGTVWNLEAYPMKIRNRNPEMKKQKEETSFFDPDPDPDFDQDKADYIRELNGMIAQYEEKQAKGEDFRIFPPVRAGEHQTIEGSGNWIPGLGTENPNIAKMYQHTMPKVLKPMRKSVSHDRLLLDNFVRFCGKP